MKEYPHREDYEPENGQCEAFSLDKLFGVATLGAVASVFIYWVYQNTGEDTKKSIREGLLTGFKAAVGKG